MDPGAILAPKTVRKWMRKRTWSNRKNHDFAWKVLQKSRYGTFPWPSECVEKAIKKLHEF